MCDQNKGRSSSISLSGVFDVFEGGMDPRFRSLPPETEMVEGGARQPVSILSVSRMFCTKYIDILLNRGQFQIVFAVPTIEEN